MHISELIRLCKNDYTKINDYRIRLADRAKGFPECPDTRLVNRRNSSQATREKKCATDCYIINSFLNGERTREINEVFSSPYSVSNMETVIIDEDPEDTQLLSEFIRPNAMAILTRLQADITEISKKQKADSLLLNDLKSDVKEISVSFRIFHGHLNSILCRLPTDTQASQVTKLQDDVSKLSSSLAIMNKKFLGDPGPRDHGKTQSVDIPQQNQTNRQAPETFADAVKKSSQQNTIATTPKAVSQNQTINEDSAKNSDNNKENNHVVSTVNNNTQSTYRPKRTDTNNNVSTNISHGCESNQNRETPSTIQLNNESNPRRESSEDRAGKFIAARRRKTTSYFIGNIDASVDESDIRGYLRERNISPTRLTMFHGKYGSSARINFYYEDEYRVENLTFWPQGVTCRRWTSKAAYERERGYRRSNSYSDRTRSFEDYGYDNYKYHDHRSHRKNIGDYDGDDDRAKSFWSSNNDEIDW